MIGIRTPMGGWCEVSHDHALGWAKTMLKAGHSIDTVRAMVRGVKLDRILGEVSE